MTLNESRVVLDSLIEQYNGNESSSNLAHRIAQAVINHRHLEKTATPPQNPAPVWAKGWVERPLKQNSNCGNCGDPISARTVAWVSYGQTPRCNSCGAGHRSQ